MDQLEQMPLIRSNDIHALEKFADLVRITVVKLQAEGKDGGLSDGTLHSSLVKKLPDRQLENYSGWLNRCKREKSVTAFRDWLKDRVRFQVEAAEMANRLESKSVEHVRPLRAPKYPDSGRMQNFHMDAMGNQSRNTRSPCSLRQSLNRGVEDRWQFAKERMLCFPCLASDHRGKGCRKACCVE